MSNKMLFSVDEAGLYRYNVADTRNKALLSVEIGGKQRLLPVVSTSFKKIDRHQIDCAIDGTLYISSADGSITTGTVVFFDGAVNACNSGDIGGAIKELLKTGGSLKDKTIKVRLYSGGHTSEVLAEFNGVITGTDIRSEFLQDLPIHIVTATVMGALQ